MRINLPNQITLGRFVLAIVCLALLHQYDFRAADSKGWMLDAAFWLFIVAALSDILDGYLARKHNQITSFGRILDPFVDKTLVCGAFILLLGEGFHDRTCTNVTGLSAWMVVVIVGRELLVTSLRGFSESRGTPFAANYWGKCKMLVQSITIPLIIKTIDDWRDIPWIMTSRTVMIWLTVGITLASVFAYLLAARKSITESASE
jgi:CDP-diacylglycerol--glycerol-3-phosphate 3-phosphatidyltransferase